MNSDDDPVAAPSDDTVAAPSDDTVAVPSDDTVAAPSNDTVAALNDTTVPVSIDTIADVLFIKKGRKKRSNFHELRTSIDRRLASVLINRASQISIAA